MSIPSFLLQLMRRDKIPGICRLEPEQRESIKLADEMRVRTLDGTYRGVWIHVPNEGKRHRLVAVIMKAMGLLPGATDYIFDWRDNVLYAELKIKPNKQSDNQKNFQQWVERTGREYLLAYSHEEVLQKLANMGAFTGGRLCN